MKTIAISAPYHFCSQKSLFESLDSIITEKENIKLISPALASLNNLLREYAVKNGFESEMLIADWSNEINADLERDKRMIANSDELIVFDDGCSNKINLLKLWATEKNIPLHIIEILPNDSIKYAEIIAKDLDQFINKDEILMAIEGFEQAKEQAIKEAQYETAAIIRDKIRILSLRLLQ